jgi:hypothetical protein
MNDLYKKLVDLYAGRELPGELEKEMEVAAANDAALEYDMRSMRSTVEEIRSLPGAEFTEESYQRILMRLYARGAEIQPKAPAPPHLQYQLPIQG